MLHTYQSPFIKNTKKKNSEEIKTRNTKRLTENPWKTEKKNRKHNKNRQQEKRKSKPKVKSVVTISSGRSRDGKDGRPEKKIKNKIAIRMILPSQPSLPKRKITLRVKKELLLLF